MTRSCAFLLPLFLLACTEDPSFLDEGGSTGFDSSSSGEGVVSITLTDTASGEVCETRLDPDTGACVDCVVDVDCGGGVLELCVRGECLPRQEFWVDGSALEGGYGAEDAPFRSLGEAWSHIRKLEDVTVYVRPGVYVESDILVEGDRQVRIVGVVEERHDKSVVIVGPEKAQGFVVVREASVLMEDLVFEGFPYPILGFKGADIDVRRSWIVDGEGDGILVVDSLLSLRDSVVQGFGSSGVRIAGSSSASLTNVHVYECGEGETGAVAVFGSSELMVTFSTFAKNVYSFGFSGDLSCAAMSGQTGSIHVSGSAFEGLLVEDGFPCDLSVERSLLSPAASDFHPSNLLYGWPEAFTWDGEVFRPLKELGMVGVFEAQAAFDFEGKSRGEEAHPGAID